MIPSTNINIVIGVWKNLKVITKKETKDKQLEKEDILTVLDYLRYCIMGLFIVNCVNTRKKVSNIIQ
jgi:hypothetical protein